MTEGMRSLLLSPAKRQRAVEQTRTALGRDRMTTGANVGHARCWGSNRNTQRRTRHVPDDEPRLVIQIVWLACEYGRYGYRRITALVHYRGMASEP